MTITTADEISEQAAWDAIKAVAPSRAEEIRRRVEMRQTATVIAQALAGAEIFRETFYKAASHLWRQRLKGA